MNKQEQKIKALTSLLEKYSGKKVELQEGFMGLKSYLDSDTAADFMSDVINSVYMQFLKQSKVKSNDYNTSGAENVALLLKTGAFDTILKLNKKYHSNDFNTIFLNCLKTLQNDMAKESDVKLKKQMMVLEGVLKNYIKVW